MPTYIKKILFVLVLFNLFTACTDDYVYYKNYTIDNEQWAVASPLNFILNVTDTITNHDIGFTIRYNDNYEFQQIYFFIYTNLPNGKEVIDTVSCDLFQPDGKAFGKGGRIKELNVIYGTLTFPLQGKYTMKVKHAMRVDTLTGINSIGLFIAPKRKDDSIKSEQ
ncbi:MAG TPA: gliding motility lipoprotein GldH [Bacteroidales bacterium]|jgi:gliding motility-associated lipoprotein GldH|nr:gliding motility lipoprotein GldH [Bacteroidales bacterium]HON20914.1 gliding motility lipoprotein GldH [Bacteroidales bacterium]HOR81100.1 gliding motility lipoprotein GldH [Bacteroidales bacterium]HPJ90778.1 gliding motility lipoprotein GldH [Bacteroidales bacterium]HPX59081.1 gliding motility lipoprotein GldH [Bacteroidales bacterium]